MGWCVREAGNWGAEQGLSRAEPRGGFQEGSSRDCSEQACLFCWNSPSQRRQGARDFLLPSEFSREPLSGLNQVAGSGGNGLRILRSEGSVPGLRICSLCEHGTKPLLFPNK